MQLYIYTNVAYIISLCSQRFIVTRKQYFYLAMRVLVSCEQSPKLIVKIARLRRTVSADFFSYIIFGMVKNVQN